MLHRVHSLILIKEDSMSIFNNKSTSLTHRGEAPWSLWQKEVSDLFDRFNRDFGPLDRRETQEFFPKIEFKVKDKTLIVCAEVPGINEKDVHVTFKDNQLILEGERKTENKEEKGGHFRSEFSYGRFYRSIPIGEEIKEDTIKASYKDGLLKIEMEKVEEQSKNAKKIPISRS